MNLRTFVWIPALLVGMAVSAGCARESARVSYGKDVAPLLEKYCQSCHVPGQLGYESSGFEVKDYDSLMKGTKYGAVVTDHILFIASGAFHTSKPSDLVPEMQGRFRIRV